MASGSSGRPNSGSKGYDFASDDILCSYEDYANQESSNGNHTEPVIGTNSSKDFNRSRMVRSSVFPSTAYSQPEDSFNQYVISFVKKSMKRHTDNLMRFLEGISSRLSQLELYCYNLDKSIGEMRSDLGREHGEAESKLKSLEKHLQEVHRAVQILRDKQELAKTQKELAKLQLAQKESSPASTPQSGRSSPLARDPKKTENSSEPHNQQLALALPHQVAPPQQQSITSSSVAPPQNVIQQQSYYMPPTQIPNPQVPIQQPHTQYLPPASQLQDPSRVAPQSTHQPVSQTPQIQPYTQYQQQWPQQPTTQPQVRPPPTSVYPSYAPTQPSNNPSIPETPPNSMPMQVQFPSIPQPMSTRVDTMPYGYAGNGRPVPPPPQQQPPPTQIKGNFGTQVGDGYSSSGPHATLPSGNAYMMYEGEGGRTYQPPQQAQFSQGGYPSSNVPLQNPQPAIGPHVMVRNPSHSQYIRNHPHSDLIEKLVSMGFRGDHVASVIQRMQESGQPVDFNSVLDRLNGHSSTGPQRGW